jgi:hypothetical protein
MLAPAQTLPGMASEHDVETWIVFEVEYEKMVRKGGLAQQTWTLSGQIEELKH